MHSDTQQFQDDNDTFVKCLEMWWMLAIVVLKKYINDNSRCMDAPILGDQTEVCNTLNGYGNIHPRGHYFHLGKEQVRCYVRRRLMNGMGCALIIYASMFENRIGKYVIRTGHTLSCTF